MGGNGEPALLALTFLERMGQGAVEGVLELVDPDALADLVPLQLRGRAERVLRPYLRQVATAFPDLGLEVRRLFTGTDGTVVAEVTTRGVQRAAFLGIPAQGRHVDLDQVWLLHVRAGRIDGVRAYWCQYHVYHCLGVRRLPRAARARGGSDGRSSEDVQLVGDRSGLHEGPSGA